MACFGQCTECRIPNQRLTVRQPLLQERLCFGCTLANLANRKTGGPSHKWIGVYEGLHELGYGSSALTRQLLSRLGPINRPCT